MYSFKKNTAWTPVVLKVQNWRFTFYIDVEVDNVEKKGKYGEKNLKGRYELFFHLLVIKRQL